MNSRFERPLGYFGGGNKMVSISVVRVQPFFSTDPRKRNYDNVPICPSVSLNISAVSNPLGSWIPHLQLKRWRKIKIQQLSNGMEFLGPQLSLMTEEIP